MPWMYALEMRKNFYSLIKYNRSKTENGTNRSGTKTEDLIESVSRWHFVAYTFRADSGFSFVWNFTFLASLIAF